MSAKHSILFRKAVICKQWWYRNRAQQKYTND